MVPARGLASSPALTFSPNGSGIYFFQMRVKIAAGQESFAKEFSILVLAGAGGFEPPNGGIKIRCLTTWLRPNARRTILAEARQINRQKRLPGLTHLSCGNRLAKPVLRNRRFRGTGDCPRSRPVAPRLLSGFSAILACLSHGTIISATCLRARAWWSSTTVG
jgi:hypothetical protein